jgi:signal transduction histidine kinase
LRDSHGKIVGIVGISRDITARKLVELDREKLMQTLAFKNKELESILHVTSHDLRSPLVNIQGFSSELSRSCDLLHSTLKDKIKASDISEEVQKAFNKDVPEALGYILTSARKMDSLLSGLLRLSRLGQVVVDIERLDMNAMLTDVVKNIEFQVKEAGATVELETLPACFGDVSQINQIFSNILDNALKYLDESRPGMIHIYGKIENGQSIYCVEDNGVGIAPEHQNKIFEIFHRLEPDKKNGEGLGLTIVRRILDRHNGKIWVDSELGKGSKFFVSLPSA